MASNAGAASEEDGESVQAKPPKRRRSSKGGNVTREAASPAVAAINSSAEPAHDSWPKGAELLEDSYGYIQVSVATMGDGDDDAWFSDPEAGVGTASARSVSVVHGDVDWKAGLQELRRNAAKRRQAKESAGGSAPSQQQRRRPTAEELVNLVRTAIEHGDWSAIVSPPAGQLPQTPVVGAAVRMLSDNERLQVLRASAARYEEESFDRNASGTWVMQVLEQGGASLAGRHDLREALRPLLASVSQAFGSKTSHGDVLSCLGSWRLVVELAVAHRDATQASTTAVEQASRMLQKAENKH